MQRECRESAERVQRKEGEDKKNVVKISLLAALMLDLCGTFKVFRVFRDISTKRLQYEGNWRVSLADARTLFDGVVEHFRSSAQHFRHLRRDSDIVHSQHFENGVVKLQSGLEPNYLMLEKMLSEFTLCSLQPEVHQVAVVSTNFADKILSNKRRRVEVRCRSTLQVSATSNVCERLLEMQG